MEKFCINSNLKYIKRANRLDLKYEKAFTLSVLRNNFKLIQGFPEKSIRTTYVNMG